MPDPISVPPPASPTPPSRKGLSPLAWIAIVVGGVLVVGFAGCLAVGVWVFQTGQEVVREATGSDSLGGFVDELRGDPARVAAETIVRVNPELDLVSTDEDAGTVTFRNNETGEEATLNFEDIAEGRFSMTTAEGEYVLDASAAGEEAGLVLSGPDGDAVFGATTDLSDVPDWVPIYPNASQTQSAFRTVSADSLTGAVSGQTTDSAEVVLDYYEGLLEGAGYAIGTRSLTESGTGALGAITGELSAPERQVNVAAVEQNGETEIMVNYLGAID